MTAPVKKSTFAKSFKNTSETNTSNGYATDDPSSDGEQSQLRVTSRFTTSKRNWFKNRKINRKVIFDELEKYHFFCFRK